MTKPIAVPCCDPQTCTVHNPPRRAPDTSWITTERVPDCSRWSWVAILGIPALCLAVAAVILEVVMTP